MSRLEAIPDDLMPTNGGDFIGPVFNNPMISVKNDNCTCANWAPVRYLIDNHFGTTINPRRPKPYPWL